HYIHDRPEEYANRLKAGTLHEVVRPAPTAGRRRFFRAVTTVVTLFAFLAASYTLLLVLWPLVF
ncbi:MAG TPA: hypothetical protein VFD74_07175, partial [Thermoleophilia bacterium]|nr:hypothetical protein [Thermoleophilia bacterium]